MNIQVKTLNASGAVARLFNLGFGGYLMVPLIQAVAVAWCIFRNMEYRRFLNRAEELYVQVKFPSRSSHLVFGNLVPQVQ